MMDKIKIMIADDQELIRDSLSIVLGANADMEVTGLAGNGRELIELIEKGRKALPDVVLMDVRMPELDGVEATHAVKERWPQVRIIILTTFDDDEYVFNALKYGASGYLGSCLDNGGGCALVHSEPIPDWRDLDLPNTRVEVSLNGRYVKEGFGRAAMGHPLTSLTWMTGWLGRQGMGLSTGDVVSTGTCTGHCFAAPGDRVVARFGEIGEVEVRYGT